jgi:hypothetical protein
VGIIIREAALPADKSILLDTLLRNRDHGDQALRQARFEWSLTCNPYGQPRAWLAMDESSNQVIGAVSAFPRRVLIHGQPALWWNGADTSIDQAFRTLGVAMKLRRAVKECVDRGEMRLLYSHPVDNMRLVLEKIGHVVIGRLARHGLVLRFDRFINERLGKNIFSAVAAGLVNPLLRITPGNFGAGAGLAIRRQEQNRFGEEYDALFERAAKNYAVITERNARFLAWRFLQNPLHPEFHIFRLEAEQRLCGFALVDLKADGGARILDYLLEDFTAYSRPFFAGIIRWLRQNRVSSLSIRSTDLNPILKVLQAFGPVFCDAVNSAIAVHAPADGPDRSVLEINNWFMTQADRDV